MVFTRYLTMKNFIWPFFYSYPNSSLSVLTDVPQHGALLLNIECLSEVGSRTDRPEILDQALLHPT